MTGLADVDDRLWGAIGDPSRRRIIDLLLERGTSTASGLSRQLPITRQAIAKHLLVLERVGLVRSSPIGREVRYRMESEQFERAVRQLADVGREWDQRLGRIRDIAEAIQKSQSRSASTM